MTVEERFENALEALNELAGMNSHVSNDLAAYCYDLAAWGMGKTLASTGYLVDCDSPVRPNPTDYGL